MGTYAMICNNRVIEILYDMEVAPVWPPDPANNPVTAVLCDDTVERGMIYDSEAGVFSWPESDSHSEPTPTQLDRIEETLAILTADTVTVESIDTAISEGVNEV